MRTVGRPRLGGIAFVLGAACCAALGCSKPASVAPSTRCVTAPVNVATKTWITRAGSHTSEKGCEAGGVDDCDAVLFGIMKQDLETPSFRAAEQAAVAPLTAACVEKRVASACDAVLLLAHRGLVSSRITPERAWELAFFPDDASLPDECALEAAIETAREHCRQGRWYGCFQIGRFERWHLRRGPDGREATDAYARACEQHHVAQACVELSRRRDLPEGERVLRDCCAGGLGGECCLEYGRNPSFELRPDERLQVFERGCRAESRESCFLAGMMELRNGATDAAFARLGQACDGGHAAACATISPMRGGKR